MPRSKQDVEGSGKKLKSLKVFAQIREGVVFWQTEAKIPATMADNLGWKEVGDGLREIEKPFDTDLPDFGRAVEGYGFKLRCLDQCSTVKPAIPQDEVLEDGKTKLKAYSDAKKAVTKAEETRDEKRDELRGWLKPNGAPKDPEHDEARVAQIGTARVHNSWVRGRETKFDDRDHQPVADWAARYGCADEMVQVIFHKTVSYEEFASDGVPDGYEAAQTIDPDVYDWHVGIGAVPKSVHDGFENRGNGYYALKVYETKEFGCPSCGHKVGKTMKFCGECGMKMETPE